MPATIQHNFTSPVADATGVVTYGGSTYNAADLVRPSNWNETHAVTLNASGSEIIGAFSNTPGGVSFGLETNGLITGGAPAGGGGITNINVSAGTASANLSQLIFSNSSGSYGVGGVSFGLNGSTITASANAYPLIADGTTRTPNGFPDRTQVSYSWSDATRTLTISPTGASFVFWSNGRRFEKTVAQSFVFAATEGRQYAYFDDDGNPQTTVTFSTNLILRWCITGILYWDNTNAVAVPDLQVEYHGTDWPPEVHLQQHLTVGCTYQSGLDLSLDPDQDGSSLAHIEVAGAQGYVWDEDIQHNIAARLASTTLPLLYRSGATPNWRYSNTSAALVRATGTGRAAWNQNNAGTWQLTEMTDGYFGIAYVCVGSGLTKQWFAVTGTAEYPSLDEATTAARLAPDLTGLPFQEYRIVGAIVFETSNSFTNAVKSRIRYMTDGSAWIDWRHERTVASEVTYGNNIEIVAGGTTYGNGPVYFANSNGFSFLTTAGSIVGSYTVPTQTQFVLSQSNGVTFGTNGSTVTASVKTDYAGTGFTGVNATGTLNSNGLSLSVGAGGGADGNNVLGVNGLATAATTTYRLSNANNITFGLNAGTITASASFAQSTQPVAISGSNGSFAFSTLSMGNSNGLTFYSTNGSIVGSYTVPTVPVSYVSQVNGSSGALSFGVGSSLSSSQNGSSITFGLASNITTALQSAGNYLTTARASNDAIGLNTALTANGLSVTANSSGLSINVPAWLTTAAQSNHSHGNPTLALTNLSGTTASASNGFTLSLSAAAGGGGADGYNILAAGTQTATTAGTVKFENSNGITFGLSGSTQITASHNGLTQQSTQPVAVSGSNGSFAFSTLSMGNSNGFSFYSTNGSLVGSYTVPVVPSSYVSQVNGSSGALSFATGSSLSSSQNGSSITFGLASNITTALQSAGAYLTTAALSNHSHGFSAAGGSSTFQTLSFSNANNVTFSNSNGQVVASASFAQSNQTGNFYASGNTTQLSSTAGIDLRSLSFEGAGIASVGVSNGRVLVSVPSGGGGGDGYNIVYAGTAGTTGTTWSSLSASVRLNGSNGLTVSQNNSNDIVLVAPASSSMVAGGNITLSTNGSTVSVVGNGIVPTLNLTNLSGTTATNSAGFTLSLSAAAAGGGAGITYSGYRPYADREHIAGQVGQGSLLFDPDVLAAVQFDRLVIPINCSNSSNSSGSHTISYWVGIYSQNASTLSLWGSTSTSVALTHSGTVGSYSLFSGMRLLTIPWTTTLPGGNYWYANLSRTTSGGANGSYSQFVLSQLNSNFVGHFGSSHNTTQQFVLGQGVYTATTSGMPGSVAFSQLRGSDSTIFRAPKFYFASGTV